MTQKFKTFSSILYILSDDDIFLKEYGFRISEYMNDRIVFAKKVLAIADEIQEITRKAGFSKTITGTTNVLSGSLAFSGLILAPFTGGVSLGLATWGVGCSGAEWCENWNFGISIWASRSGHLDLGISIWASRSFTPLRSTVL